MKRFCFFIIAVLMIMATSCKKMITAEAPIDQVTTVMVFSNDSMATAAVRGIYSDIMRLNNYIGNGGLSLYPGLCADELTTTTVNASYEPFRANSLLATNSAVLTFFWQKAYFHIYQANVIMDNLHASKGLSSGVQKQLEGETKFVRGFFYFYLVNLFGPVPLAITPDYRANAKMGRADTSAVYAQIISDLKDAQTLLAPGYITAEKVRPNKWAATALLARVYLYLKNWAEAEKQSTAIIQSGAYQLTAPANVFLPSSSEAILQWLPAATQGFNSAEGFDFIPASASAVPSFVLTDTLLHSFEPGDQRRVKWVGTTTVSGKTYYYPSKYKVRTGSSGAPKSEYNLVLRLAEQYLLRAEAEVYLNRTADALADITTIRNRAGLATPSLSNGDSILVLIHQERFREYFAEWGHRWFDLKRAGRVDAVLSVFKGANWQSTDARFPIPQSELNTNPFLTQNPGY